MKNKKLLAFALSMAVAAGCTACGGGQASADTSAAGSSDSTQAESSSTGDNTVIVAMGSGFSTLDPGYVYEKYPQLIVNACYENLFKFYENNGTPQPCLADTYEFSEDGLTLTVKLKDGLTFASGNKITSADVAFSINRTKNLKGNPSFICDTIESIETPDDATVIFHLNQPDSAILSKLTYSSLAVLDSAVVKENGGTDAEDASSTDTAQSFLDNASAGSGMYILTSYTPDEEVVLEKNPNYWRAGYPKLDAITWRPVVENSTRVAMALTGEADYAFPLPSEQVKMVKDKGTLRVDVTPSIMLRFVEMNLTKPVFKDVRVRQALNYAVNKEALVKVAFAGYADVAEGIAPLSVDYAVKLGPWPYDPQKAKALLKEAGYPNGFEVELWSGYNHTTASKIIQFLQQQLAQVGVKVRVRTLEAGERTSFVESTPQPEQSRHELYYIGWSSSTGELDYAVRPVLATSSFPPRGSNESYYSNPAVDQALFYALGTTDREKKSAIYAQMQETIWKDAPWIFLVSEQNIAASSKALHGFYIQPDSSFNFEEASLEPVSPMKP